MSFAPTVLKTDERVLFALRELYHSYGYAQYKVRKFEEYDLYMQNKNFLPSRQLLTFTDTNGNLMALKPDVTLSIIKNTRDTDNMKKVYYTEHVYRVPRNGSGFREILQTGLECIGDIDLYAMGEVLMLAVKSLRTISERFLLNLSHIGVISGILEAEKLDDAACSGILKAIAAKNTHELQSICTTVGLSAKACQLLQELVQIHGPMEEILPQAETMDLPENSRQALHELKAVHEILLAFGLRENINLDFSIVNDMNYYNGLFFRGFVDGLPEGVLAGGQYDNLLAKMGKHAGAIGFAVYLDQLERFRQEVNPYDVDALILYDDTADTDTLVRTAKFWTNNGKSVRVQKTKDRNLTCRQLIQITGREVKILETND